MITLPGKYSTAKIMIDQIEPECMAQVISFINHPAFTNPVAIMPDTHSGKGSVIGFTMPLTDKVIPNVIGVDIGCGMLSVNLEKQSLDYQEIDRQIRENIPFGVNVHSRGIYHMKNEFPWEASNKRIVGLFKRFGEEQKIFYDMDWFSSKCKQIKIDQAYAINSIGTLGGGNHFIEFGTSEATGDIWLTVHSGSRNFGKRVCDFWQGKAKRIIQDKRTTFLTSAIKEIKATSTDNKEIGERIEQARKEAGIGVGVSVKELEWLENLNAVN
jgi:RNA-splicing ligase RtcB